MAEPYSDEELARERGPLCGEDEGAGLWEDRLQATIRRLLRERDEARRVARVLASTISTHEFPVGVGYDVATALAYPEVPHD